MPHAYKPGNVLALRAPTPMVAPSATNPLSPKYRSTSSMLNKKILSTVLFPPGVEACPPQSVQSQGLLLFITYVSRIRALSASPKVFKKVMFRYSRISLVSHVTAIER